MLRIPLNRVCFKFNLKVESVVLVHTVKTCVFMQLFAISAFNVCVLMQCLTSVGVKDN